MKTNTPTPRPAKLKLQTETLQHLTDNVLDQVNGGAGTGGPPELTIKERSWCVCDTPV